MKKRDPSSPPRRGDGPHYALSAKLGLIGAVISLAGGTAIVEGTSNAKVPETLLGALGIIAGAGVLWLAYLVATKY